jgi:DNA mismatch repair ATPase MutS
LFLVRSPFTGEPFHEALQMRDALEQLLTVFGYLENYSYYKKLHLQVLCRPFLAPASRPTHHLKRVNRVVNATGIRSNPLFWIILNAVVPWDYYFTYQLARAKAAVARQLPKWLEVWYELEALCSLANSAYLNPGYTFPVIKEFRPGQPGPVFQARKLGHPLIPVEELVRNSFTIDRLGDIDLFTGSNMSGKSTFLRTLGINLVLAQAGGVVNARYMETIPWRLYSCIKITDSVTNGISYFYAEVKCLKKLLETLEGDHSLPLFFLIDEIFRGTNNRERLIGSRAYIEATTGKNGVGLVATHDLELVQLADELSYVRNYHFRDDISDGRMVFDYTLYPGPSPTTNAIKIMRAEGLPV